jgi:hypothetical protein
MIYLFRIFYNSLALNVILLLLVLDPSSLQATTLLYFFHSKSFWNNVLLMAILCISVDLLISRHFFEVLTPVMNGCKRLYTSFRSLKKQ